MQFACIYVNIKNIPIVIKYNNEIIEEINNIIFLGIMYDQQCNWKSHIDMICSK